MRTIICPLCGGLECRRCGGTGRRLGTVPFTVPGRWNTCFACKGTGRRSSCANCNNTGIIRVQSDSPCPSCRGTDVSGSGSVSDLQPSCPACRHFLGTGL